MYDTYFTVPVGTRVLEIVFKNDKKKMYEYAFKYRPNSGGPYDLGLEFREIIGKVNRTSWWKGCKIWLEELGVDVVMSKELSMNQESTKQVLLGLMKDGTLNVRATCNEVTSVTIPYSGGAVGKIQGTLFQSTDDEDRGGVVLRLTLENEASSFFPYAEKIEIDDNKIGGIEIHMAGEVEAEAFLDVLRCLLVREKSTIK
jgi:hypothetical protein